MTSTPLNILQQYWKYPNFRPLQEEIITAVLDTNDTFALLPTGGGKSICFQVPAMCKEGICVVISPLIALMQDQVRSLQQKGIKAIALTSGIKYQELEVLLDNCMYGNYKFLYISPERLQQELIKERLKRMPINLIAVDEAHCISQWGNDFRPSYKKIHILRELKPAVPVIALTASATPVVIEDIIQELDLFQPKVFRKSFYRKNLAYIVQHTLDKKHQLLTILSKHAGSAIIYVRNRRLSVEISDFLQANHLTATYYHGGVDAIEKNKRFQQWMHDEIRIMVATNAFGMGIDKPDVRTVIHINIPESIESYFQEAGRAGRDEQPSYAYLLKNHNDIKNVTAQFIDVLPDIHFVKLVYRKLCNYFRISYGEGEQSIQYFNFNTFCKTYTLSGLMTYNTLIFLDRCGVIDFTKRYTKKTSLHVIVSGNQLLEFLNRNTPYELITKAILRTYSGIFEAPTPINLALIATKVGVTEMQIIDVLQQLQNAELVLFEHAVSDAEITFLVPREDAHTIHRIAGDLKQQVAAKIKKVKAMIHFVSTTTSCRSNMLLSYFGEDNPTDCGQCDVCTHPTEANLNLHQIQKEIIALLTQEELSSRALISRLPYPEKIAIEVLRQLNEHRIIKINTNNEYQLI